jgi:hypothetical protein
MLAMGVKWFDASRHRIRHMTDHSSTASAPDACRSPDATPFREEKKWRRKHTLCLVLFVIWVAVAVAMFLYIHENKDKKDEDGNYVICPVPAKEE